MTSSTPTAPTSPRTNSEASLLSFTRRPRTRSAFSDSVHTTVVERALASPSSTTQTRPSRSSNLTTVSSVSELLPRSRRPADSNVRVSRIPLFPTSLSLHRLLCFFFFIIFSLFLLCAMPLGRNKMVMWDKRNLSHTEYTKTQMDWLTMGASFSDIQANKGRTGRRSSGVPPRPRDPSPRRTNRRQIEVGCWGCCLQSGSCDDGSGSGRGGCRRGDDVGFATAPGDKEPLMMMIFSDAHHRCTLTPAMSEPIHVWLRLHSRMSF